MYRFIRKSGNIFVWKFHISSTARSALYPSCIFGQTFPLPLHRRLASLIKLTHVKKTWNPCLLHTRLKSYGTDSEVAAVETELLELIGKKKQGDIKIQMALFHSLCKDVSDPTPQLVAKLNSEVNVSADGMFALAKAALKAKNKVADSSFLMAIATSLFGCSGDMGNTDSQYFYAQILFKGQGVEQNLTKAAEIFDKLALSGHPFAQFTLGSMYYYGQGVERNFKTAYTLFKVSAQNFVPQAYNMLGNMHHNGEGVEKDKDKAVEYYQKGCEFGDPSAHMNMGYCYSNGDGVEKSPEKSFKHFLEASKVNNPIALHNVGTSYLSGTGVEKDYAKAKEYLEKACIQGFHPSQINLGNMYYSGVGVEKDTVKAKELFRLAAEQDEGSAKYLEMIEEEEKKLGK